MAKSAISDLKVAISSLLLGNFYGDGGGGGGGATDLNPIYPQLSSGDIINKHIMS